MRRTSFSKRATIVVAAVLFGSPYVPSTFAQSGFTFTPIVKRHDPSPDGRTFFDCDQCAGEIPSNSAFNNRGDLVIRTSTQDYCDLAGFLISGENRITLSAGCRQTPWGELQFSDASINDQGQVVFTAYSYVDNQFNKLLLFLYSDGANPRSQRRRRDTCHYYLQQGQPCPARNQQ